MISRPVFSDPLTAGLKPTSNGETKAQRGMIDEVPEIRCFCKFEFPTHAFGADETLDSLDQIRGGITPQWVAELIVFSNLGSRSLLGFPVGFHLCLPCAEVHRMNNGIQVQRQKPWCRSPASNGLHECRDNQEAHGSS